MAVTDKSRVRPSSPRLHLQRGGTTVDDTLRDAVNMTFFLFNTSLDKEMGDLNTTTSIKSVFEHFKR